MDHTGTDELRVYSTDIMNIVVKPNSKPLRWNREYGPVKEGKLREYGCKSLQRSLDTDTLMLLACEGALRENRRRDLASFQRLYFELFPDDWSHFYAEMISTETGNRDFRVNARKYIDRLASLTAIPTKDRLRKMVSVSIGATADGDVAEYWRQTVSRFFNGNRQDGEDVLLEFMPWQRTSFKEFLSDNADL